MNHGILKENTSISRKRKLKHSIFICQVCKASFNTWLSLKKHEKNHAKEFRFKCTLCQKKFHNFRKGLKSHLWTHIDEKPHSCDVCGRGFTEKATMVNHRRIHTGDKPFECKVCKATFACNRTLIYHMRIHTGEKPFQCTKCDKSFSRSSFLKSHLITHSGECIDRLIDFFILRKICSVNNIIDRAGKNRRKKIYRSMCLCF